MKTLCKFLALAAIPAMLLGACGKKADDSKKAQADYAKSLQDSIEIVKHEIDSCRDRVTVLRDQVNVWLRDFTTVANPREVGSYLIYTKFKDRYPSQSTGLTARILDNGQFELVATLAGGQPFDQINVQGPESGLSSAVVPNDQALNYRTEGLTTVSFTGAKADSIGQLIADNELNPITVNYLQGRPVKAWKVPEDYAKMLSATYLLYRNMNDARRLELRVPMLERKIALIKSHLSASADAESKKR